VIFGYVLTYFVMSFECIDLQGVWITVVISGNGCVHFLYSFRQCRRFDIRLVGIHPGQERP
jgi:hypothetical protein